MDAAPGRSMSATGLAFAVKNPGGGIGSQVADAPPDKRRPGRTGALATPSGRAVKGKLVQADDFFP
ncbi:hypothetical protein [Streptomyces sp. NPDC088348]|uniref:hypothetical protein n=1 Tax=Streptomyces sp. NPDC088348 TaxID=3365853 RepID=UPI00382223E0